MTCPTIDAERLGAYLDGELDLTSALDLERHLAGCPDCTRALAAQRALSSAIGAAGLRHPPLPGERERLRRSLRAASPAPLARFPAPRLRALASLAALLAVAVVSWNLGRFGRLGPGGPGASPEIAGEVVASHVRSLLAGHPADVPSSDHHTVKPWFAGRLDYAPEVVDLAAQGYPLAGGRLDYLDGRPVAALLYRDGRHLVNVFTWPAREPPSPPATTTVRGYHLVHWAAAGMTWWAVSDASPESLEDLARRLRRAING
jgi:anti-sigma factor RsiW